MSHKTKITREKADELAKVIKKYYKENPEGDTFVRVSCLQNSQMAESLIVAEVGERTLDGKVYRDVYRKQLAEFPTARRYHSAKPTITQKAIADYIYTAGNAVLAKSL